MNRSSVACDCVLLPPWCLPFAACLPIPEKDAEVLSLDEIVETWLVELIMPPLPLLPPVTLPETEDDLPAYVEEFFVLSG